MRRVLHRSGAGVIAVLWLAGCLDEPADPGRVVVATTGLQAFAPLTVGLPTGSSCSAPGDCATGFCVDGYCCGTACNGGICDGCSVATGSYANGTCTPFSGFPCNDGNACTQLDMCQSGVCVGANPVVCPTPDQCHNTGVCSTYTGVCSNPAKSNGTACNDGNGCTQADTCQSGVCTGANPVACPTPDQCHTAGACNPSTGVCSNPATSDDTACNDGNACTLADTCQSGVCTGANPVACPIPDQCHEAGVCNPLTGVCSNPAKPNGTACNDGNGCTQTDTCQSGVCTGANPVACVATDACHVIGTCNVATGVCTNPPKTNGSVCDDADVCTQGDACQNGICVPGIAADCGDGNPCTDDSCDPVAGCVRANNSGPCDDGNACTTEQCAGGKCAATAVSCDDEDACTQDACDPGTGCAHLPVAGCCSTAHACPDGQVCKADTCANLLCLPCTQDQDCVATGATCRAVGAATYCLPACPDGACPSGSSCQDDRAGGSICLPDAGWCQCVEPASPAACEGDLWVHHDSCGVVEATESCAHGCVPVVGCCADGTHADGAACAADPVEPAPEAGAEETPIDELEPTGSELADLAPETSPEASAEVPADVPSEPPPETPVEVQAEVSTDLAPTPDPAVEIVADVRETPADADGTPSGDADDPGPDGNETGSAGGGGGCSDAGGATSGGAMLALGLAVALFCRRRRPV